MSKPYNTPKRTHIVKTRLDDEEHADFLHQVEIYGMNHYLHLIKAMYPFLI